VRRAVSLLALSLLAACGGGSGASTTAPGDGPPASGLSLPPVAGAPSPPAAQPGHLRLGPDWPTYHHENSRGGYVGAGPDPQAPAVAWQAALDGKVYASPLVVGGRVLAATEGGSLYSLDGATGRVLWRRHLADPIPAASQPCGNIDPLGVTGTPVYDPASHQVFAVTTEAGSRHVLFAVDAATGRVRSQRAVDAPGSVPATQLQRGALLLAGHTVYIAYGGNLGDCGAYLGRVVAVPVAGGALRSFAVPTSREAGIWAASGPAATPAGGDWDHSDSVLGLSPALAAGRLRAAGLGPGELRRRRSGLYRPGPAARRYAGARGRKGGSAYLVDIGHLGGVGGERASLRDCSSYGGAAAAPVTGGGAVAYLPCSGGLLQVRVQDGRLSRGWQAQGQVNGSPVVVGRTVWSVQQDGALYGLDAATGRQRALVQVGDASRFATPAASGNALLIPTLRGVTAVRLTS